MSSAEASWDHSEGDAGSQLWLLFTVQVTVGYEHAVHVVGCSDGVVDVTLDPTSDAVYTLQVLVVGGMTGR